MSLLVVATHWSPTPLSVGMLLISFCLAINSLSDAKNHYMATTHLLANWLLDTQIVS